ncbi:MAG: hypothetical protein ACE5MI_13260 [Acidimicrobiia bacterium]
MFRFQRRRFQWWLRQITDRQINAFARVGVAVVLLAAAGLALSNWLSQDSSSEPSGQLAAVGQLLPGDGLPPQVQGPGEVESTTTSSSPPPTAPASPPATTEVLAAGDPVPTTTAPSAPPSEDPTTSTTEATPPTTKPATTTTLPTTTTSTTAAPTTTTLPPTTTILEEQLTVATMTPSEIEAGSSVTAEITGSGFVAGLTVTFSGGQGPRPQASNYVVTSNTITFRLSVGGGGPDRDRQWVVTVTNPGGESASLSQPLTVTSD